MGHRMAADFPAYGCDVLIKNQGTQKRNVDAI